MIEIKHLTKKFGKETVLKDINVTFPDYGIVAIYGPSGCGKTTLLNCISSLYDFEGEISLNGAKYSSIKEDQKDQLRNMKMGFVFQDYKLFEYETIKNNILFAIDLKSSDKKSNKERRVKALVKIIGLDNKLNEPVSNLSGGEKQRVALARAICNSPKILLADEPTGNLDEKSSEAIMKILQKISKNSLVIIVSHDEALTKKYADQIMKMKDGEIEQIEYCYHNKHEETLPLISLKPRESKSILPFNFCIRHTINSVKRRKWRTALSFLTTSLGLIGVGLSVVLSSIISTNLYKSYSSIIDTDKIIVSNKNNEVLRDKTIISQSFIEVNDYFENSKNNIKAIGVYYWNNFDLMFPQSSFYISESGNKKILPSLLLNHFNEFDMLENNKSIIYPLQLSNISNNEVILKLDYQLLNEICFQLQIVRTVESLSKFIKYNNLSLTINVENQSWGYMKEFNIRIAGFILANSVGFYHSNRNWNQYIFENVCYLPTTEYINVNTSHPWDIKKSFYLEFKSNRDAFLEDIRFNKKHRYEVAEILGENYYPNLFKGCGSEECCRVAMLNYQSQDKIEAFIGGYLKSSSSHIKNAIYAVSAAYSIYPDNLMMGFARSAFLSNYESHIDEVIDLTTYIKYEDSLNISIPDSVVQGHFSKPNSSGLTFNPDYDLIQGEKPRSYSEIVISDGLCKQLALESPINQIVYFAYPIKEDLLSNGYIRRTYETVGLKVVGISNSQKIELSHQETWTVLFFQAMLGVSSFSLSIDSVALEIDENSENEVIESLIRAFPQFESVYPLSSVKDSVNKVCGYIETIILILSISSIIIASFLLTICNYLHFKEIKKDIGLVRCLGIGKNESAKFVFFHAIFMSMISFIISSIELAILCFVMSKAFSSIFYIESSFVFNPLSLVYMFLLALGISLLSSIVIRKKVISLSPIDCLRY